MPGKLKSTAAEVLLSSKRQILEYLNNILKSKGFRYETFGKDIEDHLVDVLVRIFTKSDFIKSKSDYTVARNKNDFPDFILNTKPPIAIEFKAGNRSRQKGGKWVNIKNSANDMGTLNSWPSKLKKFPTKNIYGIFVIYDFNDKSKVIHDIEIDYFYKFLCITKKKILSYREKDGNLRPRDFNTKCKIENPEEFEKLLVKTGIYRSKRIIKKHQKNINELKTLLRKA